MNSTKDYIEKHISLVRQHIQTFIQLLTRRALHHDESKLKEPELTWWKQIDKEPKYPYGSPEYNAKMSRWSKLFQYHYAHNRHHPEHYQFGVRDMTLIDMIEMLCDWLGYKDNLSISEAFQICETQMQRYDMSEDIRHLIFNTLCRYFAVLGGDPANIPDGIEEELYKPKKKNSTQLQGNFIDLYV